MATIRLRLCEKDRPEYERGDEWFHIDAELAELDDLTWDELDAVEREIDMSAYVLIEVERRTLTARYWRVALWLARKWAGIREPYAEFKPNVRRLDMDTPAEPEDDADPPADTRPRSQASSPSAKRSSPRTRRSPATTT